MAKKVSIFMYHYVRELKTTRYPGIKGLSVDLFRKQMDYVKKNCNAISMEELISCLRGECQLPPDAVHLSFDDGFIDHFVNVLPLLNEFGVRASFFPSAVAVKKGKVVDIHKVHFILASVLDKSELIKNIYSLLDEFRSEYSLMDNRYYYKKFAVPSRFDSGETRFIKRILDRGLPEDLREKILKRLFNKYVTSDEESFSKELYMNVEQLKQMKKGGMFIGSHGFNHCWLGSLDKNDQIKEIDLSLEFLGEIGYERESWAISYPYGDHPNDSLLSILKERGCALGFAADFKVADLDKDNPLILPRLDANDLTAKIL